MRTKILACETLRDELALAIEQTGVNYPVGYVESGLHSRPESLRRRIQEEIDKIDGIDILLLVFGYCGNSFAGVTSTRFKMVLPRIDDCIPLLLGLATARDRVSQETGTYFFTKGWLDHEHNIIQDYVRCCGRYGEQRALKVMKKMLAHYGRMMVIDTGAYPVGDVARRTEEFAAKLEKRHEIVPGSLRLLCKLLRGEWDEEFIILEPGQGLTIEDMTAGGQIGAGQLSIGMEK